jgi:hypothetical protein
MVSTVLAEAGGEAGREIIRHWLCGNGKVGGVANTLDDAMSSKQMTKYLIGSIFSLPSVL